MIFYVIGYGAVGKSLVNIINRFYPDDKIVVIDNDPGQLNNISSAVCQVWQSDGVKAMNYIVEYTRGKSWIIPALPRHLMFEYVLENLRSNVEAKPVAVPEIDLEIPFQYRDDKGTLYLSYADFICSPNCSEPEKFCTVTGLPREKPLYELLESIDVKIFVSYVVRSVQLAPGLGGFEPEDALQLKDRLIAAEKGNFLISTSCSCHSVTNAVCLKNKS